VTYSERTGSVASSGPRSATVEAEALVPNNLDEATGAERLRVGPAGGRGSVLSQRQSGVRCINSLTLDLEDVEGKKDDLSNSGEPGKER
jgi:hypothetical protein